MKSSQETVTALHTSKGTTSTTTYSMLECAPLEVQQAMARRGYKVACGLAILLSTLGQPPPLAASPSTKLPFERLEAGYVQGGSSGGFSYVLFRMPGSEYNDLYQGSFFCSSVCTLPRPLKTFVVNQLEQACCGALTNHGTTMSRTATTVSTTPTSLHQPGKQRSTPTRVSKTSCTTRLENACEKRGTTTTSSGGSYPVSRMKGATTVSTTTSLHQAGKQRSTPRRVSSIPLPQVLPVMTQVTDGDLQAEGPYGVRTLSFQFAWDFRKRHDRGRSVQAVQETCPAFVTGMVQGSSRETFVTIAREQDSSGRLFALVAVPKATQGLLRQLPPATTAVAIHLVVPGPSLNILTNDKTLVRIFEAVAWHKCEWVSSDSEELEWCVRAFLDCLCHSDVLHGNDHPAKPAVQATVDKHRHSFDALVQAVQLQTAATFRASVASSFGESEDSQVFAAFAENVAANTSRMVRGSTSRASFPAAVEPELESGMQGEEEDEALQEVRGALRPVTENSQVAAALEKVEDFRKHEPTGRFSLHPSLRRELFKVHRNLNHPAKDVFLRALRHSGVREDVLQWAKEFFVCPLCEAAKQTLPARPAHLAKALEFNAVVAIDLCYLNLFGAERIFLLCLDHGTGYLQVVQCEDAKALTVRRAFNKFWIAPFGVPEVLICDQGPEFAGEQFVEFVSQMGAAVHFTDAASPWKNGRAERAVGTFKRKLKVVLQETSASPEELDCVVAQVVAAHNSLSDRHGYSPNQRLFGRSLRLPGSLMATDRWDQEMIKAAAGDVVQRSWAIRDAARAAWIKEDDVTAVHRASAAQTRRSDVHAYSFQPGQWVFVWRKTGSRYGWVGPGALLAMTPGGNTWWVNMRGRLWKVSAEQLRPASSEEDLGAALVLELHRDLLDQIRQGVRSGYEDVTQEGEPPRDELEELFPDVFGEDDRPELPQLEVRSEPAGDRPGDDLTTTAGDNYSERPLPSEPNLSRRHSAASVPVESNQGEAQGSSSSSAAAPSLLPDRPPIRVDEASSGSMLLGPVRERRGPPIHNPYFAKETFLEEEIKPSVYLEVMAFDQPDVGGSNFLTSRGPKWTRQTTSGRTYLEPLKPQATFGSQEAEASFCERDKCMYLTKAKTSFGQVEFSKLQGEERETFRKSRAKEMESLLANKAIRVLSLKESEDFRKNHPDYVLESRFVDRYKPVAISPADIEKAKKAAVDNEELEPLEMTEDRSQPKSRWCVVGWADPHVHQIERSAPTPSSAAVNTVLQVNASRRWTTYVKDVKTAFLQSRPTSRKTPLACNQPRDECLPGLDPKQLILLLTEIYGLVSGPSWWRSSFLQRTGKLGYRICPYEPCVLVLPALEPQQPTQGLLVVEVDDVIEGGDERHRKLMNTLESEITFGKVINLQQSETSYAGKSIKQLEDFSFVMHMDEYIYTRMSPISMARKVLKKDAPNVKLDENEKSQLRGVLATLTWVGREARPDAAAASSILASTFPEPTVEVIHMANDMVRQLKQHPVKFRIHSIPEDRVRNLLISDAAFDTSGREKSQHGYLLGFTNNELNLGKVAPVSLMLWRSRRLRRKAASSMLCEALSLSAATGCLEKQDALWDALRLSSYEPRQRQRQEAEVLELQGRSTVISHESELFRDPRSVVVIDAKALYDSLLNDQAGECERSNLEVAVIKESLQVCRSRVRWVPHNFNPADSLTKYPGAHLEPLVRLLKASTFKVTDEQQTLQGGRQGLNRQKNQSWEDAPGNSYFSGAVKLNM